MVVYAKKMDQCATLTGFVVQVHVSEAISLIINIIPILIQYFPSQQKQYFITVLANNQYYETTYLIPCLQMKPSSSNTHLNIDTESNPTRAFFHCRQTLSRKTNIFHKIYYSLYHARPPSTNASVR